MSFNFNANEGGKKGDWGSSRYFFLINHASQRLFSPITRHANCSKHIANFCSLGPRSVAKSRTLPMQHNASAYISNNFLWTWHFLGKIKVATPSGYREIRSVSGRVLDNLLELAPSVNRLATNTKKKQQNRASEASLAGWDPDHSRLSPSACCSFPYITQSEAWSLANLVRILYTNWEEVYGTFNLPWFDVQAIFMSKQFSVFMSVTDLMRRLGRDSFEPFIH